MKNGSGLWVFFPTWQGVAFIKESELAVLQLLPGQLAKAREQNSP